MVSGAFPEDRAYLKAIERAAGRFGGTIVEEREYKETPGARRSDTGQMQIQRQMPVFKTMPKAEARLITDYLLTLREKYKTSEHRKPPELMIEP